MQKARSFFDFINVELYTENGYSVKLGMKYWIYSELHNEYQEYEITEGTKYDELKFYIEKGLLFI